MATWAESVKGVNRWAEQQTHGFTDFLELFGTLHYLLASEKIQSSSYLFFGMAHWRTKTLTDIKF